MTVEEAEQQIEMCDCFEEWGVECPFCQEAEDVLEEDAER
jgi:hypothetical protein